jgi:hypothetical protein
MARCSESGARPAVQPTSTAIALAQSGIDIHLNITGSPQKGTRHPGASANLAFRLIWDRRRKGIDRPCSD